MWIDKGKLKLLIDIAYLDNGLAIGSIGWDSCEGNQIRNSLEQLSYSEARKAKRKFRKLHRRIKKEKIKEAEKWRPRSAWVDENPQIEWPQPGGSVSAGAALSRPWHAGRRARDATANKQIQGINDNYGNKGERPNLRQARARRRAVDYYLRGKLDD